jgi:dTDP-4-amino-4,6-dideoxygalactose transaminase
MGTLIGILYQNAIPVFADLDQHTYNLTADTIAARITPKTKAIIVVHLAGNAADMDPILALARLHRIQVIEDCAQSYLCYYKGKLVGTLGDIGCFSLNDFKHISAGDGGMLIMNDEDLYYRAFRFADKNYDRFSKEAGALRRIEYLAPNYRMTELQGAVGLAQLDRLASICEIRNRYGDELTQRIKDLPGIDPPAVQEGCKSSYWFYMFRVDEGKAGVSRDEFSRALATEGVPNSPGYIPGCVYEYEMFRNRSAFPDSNIPFGINHTNDEIRYEADLCPVAESILRTAVRVSINEFYTEQDMKEMGDAICKVSQYYSKRR